MDTKKLHDLALEAGINPLKDESAYHDCIAPWTEYLLKTPEELIDVFVDFMSDIPAESDDFKSICSAVSRANQTMKEIGVKNSHIPHNVKAMNIWGSMLMIEQSEIGMIMQQHLTTQAEAYATEYAEEWYADVQSYAGEMEEGMADDHAYEQRKDRMLEEKHGH